MAPFFSRVCSKRAPTPSGALAMPGLSPCQAPVWRRGTMVIGVAATSCRALGAWPRPEPGHETTEETVHPVFAQNNQRTLKPASPVPRPQPVQSSLPAGRVPAPVLRRLAQPVPVQQETHVGGGRNGPGRLSAPFAAVTVDPGQQSSFTPGDALPGSLHPACFPAAGDSSQWRSLPIARP